ncbi:hypothetical protein [Deinococcus pimensis]|nr:hypothetical protein [Deinococcus pimensis]
MNGTTKGNATSMSSEQGDDLPRGIGAPAERFMARGSPGWRT